MARLHSLGAKPQESSRNCYGVTGPTLKRQRSGFVVPTATPGLITFRRLDRFIANWYSPALASRRGWHLDQPADDPWQGGYRESEMRPGESQQI